MVGLSEKRTDFDALGTPGFGERLRNEELEGTTRGRSVVVLVVLVAWEKVEEREGSLG